MGLVVTLVSDLEEQIIAICMHFFFFFAHFYLGFFVVGWCLTLDRLEGKGMEL